MPAEIEERDGVAQMFYSLEDGVPWHGLGTEVPEAVTSKEALALSGLDWKVALGPLYGGPDRKHIKKVEDRFAIYRDVDGKVLGVGSERYRPFNNEEIFAFMDSLVKDGVMTYSAAGALMGGRQVWMLGKMEKEWMIGDDKFTQYILATSGHDAMNALRLIDTNVRVICHNTVQAALWGRVPYKVVHLQDTMDAQLTAAKEALSVTTEGQRRLTMILEKAQIAKVSAKDVEFVQDGLFGSLDDKTPAQRRHAIEAFQAIYVAEKALSGATAYALVNTVTGYADHSRSYQGNDEQKAERRFRSITSTQGQSYQFKRKGIELVKSRVTGLASL